MAHLVPASEYCVVLTTASSETEAKTIAQTLVQEKLAACVNLFPIQSIYIWQAQLQEETEWQMLIKTNFNCFSKLKDRILELHSYDVPEIIMLSIHEGSPDYLAWIGTQVQGS